MGTFSEEGSSGAARRLRRQAEEKQRTLCKTGKGLRHPRLFLPGAIAIVASDDLESFDSQRRNSGQF